jgi:hypothetical protein
MRATGNLIPWMIDPGAAQWAETYSASFPHYQLLVES